jgi:hypothetical protein
VNPFQLDAVTLAPTAYLVRLTRSPNGHPSSTYVDFRDEQADAALQAQRIVEYVEGEDLQAQQANDQSPQQSPPTRPRARSCGSTA